MGKLITQELRPGGKAIPVTNENKLVKKFFVIQLLERETKLYSILSEFHTFIKWPISACILKSANRHQLSCVGSAPLSTLSGFRFSLPLRCVFLLVSRIFYCSMHPFVGHLGSKTHCRRQRADQLQRLTQAYAILRRLSRQSSCNLMALGHS